MNKKTYDYIHELIDDIVKEELVHNYKNTLDLYIELFGTLSSEYYNIMQEYDSR